MEKQIKENKVTVQGLNNPVPAASVDLLASHVPSSSSDREHKTTTEVGTLASVADNVPSVQYAYGKNIEVKETGALGGGFKLSQPLNKGEGSDSESSKNTNMGTPNPNRDEVDRLVEEVSDSIAKLSTTRKRLSGAQRRKLKKMHQKNILGQSRDAPTVESDPPTSNEAKRIRSPEELTTESKPKKKKSSPSSNRLTNPSHTSLKEDSCQNSASKGYKDKTAIEKASTSAKSTPKERASGKKPIPTRKRKLDAEMGKEPPSYAKVARGKYRDDLCYAVYDTGNPTGKIPKDQFGLVEDLVNNKIVDYAIASKGKQPIESVSSEFVRGVMIMRLASHQCAGTLKNLVESIPPPWDGAKLGLVKKRDLPELVKSTIYIKGWGSKLANERILEILGSQNAKLAVEKWEVFHRKEDPEGTLLVIGIDQDSRASLAKNKGMAFFASKTVFFKSGKVPIGGEVQANPVGSSDTPKTAPTTSSAAGNQEDSVPKSEVGITNSQEDRLLEGHD